MRCIRFMRSISQIWGILNPRIRGLAMQRIYILFRRCRKPDRNHSLHYTVQEDPKQTGLTLLTARW